MMIRLLPLSALLVATLYAGCSANHMEDDVKYITVRNKRLADPTAHLIDSFEVIHPVSFAFALCFL